MEKNENSLANNQIEEIYVILNELKNKQECMIALSKIRIFLKNKLKLELNIKT